LSIQKLKMHSYMQANYQAWICVLFFPYRASSQPPWFACNQLLPVSRCCYSYMSLTILPTGKGPHWQNSRDIWIQLALVCHKKRSGLITQATAIPLTYWKCQRCQSSTHTWNQNSRSSN
jgi:hypothetical protein